MWLVDKFFAAAPHAFNRRWIFKKLDDELKKKRATPTYEPREKLLYALAASYPYHLNGYAARSHELLKLLKDAGQDVIAFTRCGYPWDRADSLAQPLAESCEVEGVSYEHSRKPAKYLPLARYAPRAADVVARNAEANGCGAIHAPSNHVNALPALLAARRLGLPFQYEMRGLWELSRASRFPAFADSPSYRLGLDLEAFVAREADRVFVISAELGKYISENWGVDSAKIRLLPNCVNPLKFAARPMAADNKFKMVYAGSLVEYEGLDTLIEAIDILRGEKTEICLDIIGRGEAGEKLRALTREKNLEDRVKFLGAMPPADARARVASCSLVCLPRKPYKVCELIPPIKLVEAMAFGRPVVVPDLPVFRDELGDLACGWTFKSGDAVDLARVLKRALLNPQARAEQGEKARERVLATRDWSDYAFAILPWKN